MVILIALWTGIVIGFFIGFLIGMLFLLHGMDEHCPEAYELWQDYLKAKREKGEAL